MISSNRDEFKRFFIHHNMYQFFKLKSVSSALAAMTPFYIQ